MTCRGDPIGVHFMSRATETVAPPNLSCHPERMSRSPECSEGEGSLCPTSQTLRGVYPERSEWAQGDNCNLTHIFAEKFFWGDIRQKNKLAKICVKISRWVRCQARSRSCGGQRLGPL